MIPEIQTGIPAQAAVGHDTLSRSSARDLQTEQGAAQEVAARDVFEPSSSVGSGQVVQPARKPDAAGAEGLALPKLQAVRAYEEQARLVADDGSLDAGVSNSVGGPERSSVDEAGPGEDAGENSIQNSTQADNSNEESLEPAELQQLRALQRSDSAVRAHERAHLAAAGGHARGKANFEYVQGPDGKRYAVGGEVQIDTSAEASPEATRRKMQVVRSAALAPANPSPQDRRVAAQASNAIVEAQMEMQALARENQDSQEAAQSEAERQVESSTSVVGEASGDGNATVAAEEESSTPALPVLDFTGLVEEGRHPAALPPFEFIAYTATEVSPPASPPFEFVARSTSETGAIPVERYQGVNVVV